ncbi:MAG TPA: L,D-transpeptidase family protein [Solirubrobacteraceae bacterium]|nr:L,D-transpeptidase family protein [Solirubrobacteraceae bacterium]
MRRPVVMLCSLAAAAFPASAVRAQAPVAPPAAPVQTQIALKVERVGGPRASAVMTGSRIRVRGSVPVFVPGETVTVRFYIGARKRAARRVALQPQADGTGGILLSYRPLRPGTLRITATHAPSPALGAFTAKARSVVVLPRRVRPRSGSASIRALQRALRRLGYGTGSPGSFDARTARAVLAFRKVTGMARTTSASSAVMRRLARGGGRFRIRFPKHGRHIEADLSRQVIALIEGGRVRRIYPVSSGAPGTPTVVGSFKVYLKTPGTNSVGMVHSSYFVGGYAMHGYPSVPTYPASHGCLRVPIPDAKRLFNWIKIGTPVDVYP